MSSTPLLKLFTKYPPIIGMIHVGALPGTPRNSKLPAQLIDQAIAETEIYCRAGIDGLIVENMHDVPYLKNAVGPEIVAMMTRLGQTVKEAAQMPIGIQILAGANRAALAVAHAAGLDFIRAEGYVFGQVADEGYIDANAGELKRYQRHIGAEKVQILTDIKKKHSAHAVTDDVSIAETARAAEFFLSDGVIITGTATGQTADPAEIREVKNRVKIPVLVGSGVTIDNVGNYLLLGDGLIIGSHFKKEGGWMNKPDYERIARLIEKVNKLRS